MKKKLRVFALMLVAALAVTWITPATTAWAEDDGGEIGADNLIDPNACVKGGGGDGKCSSPAANGITINKASAYSNLPWYQQTQSTTNY